MCNVYATACNEGVTPNVTLASTKGETEISLPQATATAFNPEGVCMKMKMLRSIRKGFTLIEILVTVVVIGVLAAVVIPAITQQSTAGDAARIVQDLGYVAGGVERFAVEVKPKIPGDIEDLINPIAASSTGDKSVDGVAYDAADVARWLGPYMEKPTDVAGNASSSTVWIITGFAANIYQGLLLCSATPGTDGCVTTSPDYAAVKVAPLTPAQFELINKVVDGVETAGTGQSWAKGKFRFDGTTTAFYFAAPYKTP